jgi:hypothetical protein
VIRFTPAAPRSLPRIGRRTALSGSGGVIRRRRAGFHVRAAPPGGHLRRPGGIGLRAADRGRRAGHGRAPRRLPFRPGARPSSASRARDFSARWICSDTSQARAAGCRGHGPDAPLAPEDRRPSAAETGFPAAWSRHLAPALTSRDRARAANARSSARAPAHRLRQLRHPHPPGRTGLAGQEPRITLHFTPTSGSWLNMAEVFFLR